MVFRKHSTSLKKYGSTMDQIQPAGLDVTTGQILPAHMKLDRDGICGVGEPLQVCHAVFGRTV